MIFKFNIFFVYTNEGVIKMNKGKKSAIFFLVAAVLVANFIHIMINQQELIKVKKDELNVINAKIQEENKLNQELKKQKEILYGDEYIENAARVKLGMVKQGEKVFVDVNK